VAEEPTDNKRKAEDEVEAPEAKRQEVVEPSAEIPAVETAPGMEDPTTVAAQPGISPEQLAAIAAAAESSMANAAAAYQPPPVAGAAFPGLGMGMPMDAAAMETEVVDISQAVVGKIIGKSGSTISSIQDRSGSKIQIDQSMPDGQPRKVSISGTPQSIAAAKAVCGSAFLLYSLL
jgi:hypothetical protein